MLPGKHKIQFLKNAVHLHNKQSCLKAEIKHVVHTVKLDLMYN